MRHCSRVVAGATSGIGRDWSAFRLDVATRTNGARVGASCGIAWYVVASSSSSFSSSSFSSSSSSLHPLLPHHSRSSLSLPYPCSRITHHSAARSAWQEAQERDHQRVWRADRTHSHAASRPRHPSHQHHQAGHQTSQESLCSTNQNLLRINQ